MTEKFSVECRETVTGDSNRVQQVDELCHTERHTTCLSLQTLNARAQGYQTPKFKEKSQIKFNFCTKVLPKRFLHNLLWE